MKALIDRAVVQGLLLPRTHAELYENLRHFYIYADEKGVGGCCALRVDNQDLAEVWALVVREDLRGNLVGAALLEACVADARERGVRRVYALSRTPAFFLRHSFQEIDRYELPQKVARDCIQCHLFLHCESVAIIRDLTSAGDTPA
ncbi:MAG: GNAT family N-acetyltransferase [Candidatus Hydrogenedentes bacterium]|nr:GNAT family N-acetyltransferase [Candidatus Hydrogenedentota bacterium]